MNDELLAMIESHFKPEDRRLAVELLESISLGHVMAESETNLFNTRRSVLKISKGDMTLLRHNVDCAKTDFRDVIYWASEQENASA